MSTKKEETVLSIRIPPDLRNRIEEFTNEAGYDRPTQAVRVLIEAGLDHHDKGSIDVDRLAMLQQNATSEALAFAYGVLTEMVDRITKR